MRVLQPTECLSFTKKLVLFSLVQRHCASRLGNDHVTLSMAALMQVRKTIKDGVVSEALMSMDRSNDLYQLASRTAH